MAIENHELMFFIFMISDNPPRSYGPVSGMMILVITTDQYIHTCQVLVQSPVPLDTTPNPSPS